MLPYSFNNIQHSQKTRSYGIRESKNRYIACPHGTCNLIGEGPILINTVDKYDAVVMAGIPPGSGVCVYRDSGVKKEIAMQAEVCEGGQHGAHS